MKVLHVNTSDNEGGAGRAAYRIHSALRASGIDSHMLVLHKGTASDHVHKTPNPLRRAIHSVQWAISYRLMRLQRTPDNQEAHSLSLFGAGLTDWINSSDYDLVHLHWLGFEMMSISDLARLRKPIVWTMHDMWTFSGAEHYDDLVHQGRYKEIYSSSNRPENATGIDIDGWTWRRKKRAWRDVKFKLVGPSKWLARCCEESSLFEGQSCAVIPNCIDGNLFKPIDRRIARDVLALEADKIYILFGAISGISNRRKGFHVLREALDKLRSMVADPDKVRLLIMGADPPLHEDGFGLEAVYLGRLQDEVTIALAYSAADVFVAPSLLDNLPNTVLESMACGTPCVAFDIGGMPDLIVNDNCGTLVPPFDTTEFAKATAMHLRNTDAHDRRRQHADAMARWSYREVAGAYVELYASTKFRGAPSIAGAGDSKV